MVSRVVRSEAYELEDLNNRRLEHRGMLRIFKNTISRSFSSSSKRKVVSSLRRHIHVLRTCSLGSFFVNLLLRFYLFYKCLFLMLKYIGEALSSITTKINQ